MRSLAGQHFDDVHWPTGSSPEAPAYTRADDDDDVTHSTVIADFWPSCLLPEQLKQHCWLPLI